MNNEQENFDHVKEILSREFKGDYHTMSHKDFVKRMRIFMYQMFLIEVDDIQVTTRTNGDGCYISLGITGECFVDADSVDASDEFYDYEELDEETE